jgi:aminopeptidase N
MDNKDCMMNYAGAPPIRRGLLCVLACLVALSCASAQRLPDNVRPEHYALRFTPDLKAATYTGEESIEVTVAQPTATVFLNATEIAFQSASISAGGQDQAAAVTLDGDRQQATLTVPRSLPAGKATIKIQFSGKLNDELRGFYLSRTAKRNYAVTQFEAVDARRAFPCFDEPAFKATFSVTLVIDKGDTGISNTEIASDTPGPGAEKHTLTFGTTPRMSTYLVAFLVGDFACTSGEEDHVAIRVCSTPDKVAHTAFGLEIAKPVLHYYNSYFGIPYPLKKLDLIGLPDFEAGAMENFGAITYREEDLLLDPSTAPIAAQRNVAYVIAHEMAHQWFGDLVTMQWWNNVWLNEGFATWMGRKAVETLRPTWNMEEETASDLNYVMDLDALPTTRAVSSKADTPDEINQMFEEITYRKGAAVLRSVENYVGEETFRKGVHNYLKAHEFANATAEDFWGAQTAESHKPIDKIMVSLMTQPGIPQLDFGEPNAGWVQTGQRRFFLNPDTKSDSQQKWTLPVCFKTTQPADSCQLLSPEEASLKVPAGPVFFPNASGAGYYRMGLAKASFDSLVARAEADLTAPERINLAGNTWSEMRANQVNIGDVMRLLEAMKSDPSEALINQTTLYVGAVINQIAATEAQREKLAAWVRTNFAPQLARLGDPTPSDSPNTRQLRAALLELVGRYGKDPQVLAKARSIAEAYLTAPQSVDPTLGVAALKIAARNGDAALFDQLVKVYESGSNPTQQEMALHLLPTFEQPALTERALDYALSDKVRNQDSPLQVRVALQNPATRDVSWNYVKSHWDKVHAEMTTATGAYVIGGTSSFCSAEARQDVEQFFTTHKVGNSSTALRQAEERIDDCMKLRQLQGANFSQWLEGAK